jgi:hypothetical protein
MTLQGLLSHLSPLRLLIPCDRGGRTRRVTCGTSSSAPCGQPFQNAFLATLLKLCNRDNSLRIQDLESGVSVPSQVWDEKWFVRSEGASEAALSDMSTLTRDSAKAWSEENEGSVCSV